MVVSLSCGDCNLVVEAVVVAAVVVVVVVVVAASNALLSREKYNVIIRFE